MGAREDKPVAEVRALFAQARPEELSRLASRYGSDERAGVISVVGSARRTLAAARAEQRRIAALGSHQRSLHDAGLVVIAGIDEVGRGALAGPVTAAAVVIPVDDLPLGVDDSKKLTPEMRVRLDVDIRRHATCLAVAHVWPEQLDRMGVAAAVHEAMRLAVRDLDPASEHALVDGRDRPDLGVPVTPVIKGDALVGCIAAASIVAKVERDALMVALEDEYPGYGFRVNKGYGTAEHLAALAELGPSAVHRRSFAPCTQQPLF